MTSKVSKLEIRPIKIAKILGVITTIWTLLHLIAQYILIMYRSDIQGGFINGILSVFDMGNEMSIPTWYSQILLLIAAVTVAAITYTKWLQRDKWRWHWGLVAGVLLCASIDEGATLHEKLSSIDLPGRLGIESSLLLFSWVLPALIIITVLGLVLLRFWWSLPQRTRWLLAASVIVFLSGAVGLEMVASNFLLADMVNHSSSFMYKGVLWAIEEGLEQMGVIFIIYTMLDYASNRQMKISLIFKGR